MSDEHECGKVTISQQGVVSYPDTVECIGGCRDGCCDDYRCKVCGKTWRIEWPD